MSKLLIIGIAFCAIICSIISGVIAYTMMQEEPKKAEPNTALLQQTKIIQKEEEEEVEEEPKKETPPPPPPPKFSKGLIKDTGFNDEGNGNAVYLDRHNVTCDNEGIQRFRLIRNGQGKYRIDYTCAANGQLGASSNKDTGFNDEGNGNVIYLDRHNVDCGKDSVLSQFQLTRNGQGKFRYNYTCKSSKAPINCRDVTTPGNDDGRGNAVYLDRHDLTCADDEVMSRFQLVRPTPNTIQYQFKCCKY